MFWFSALTITSCSHEHNWNELARTNATCTEEGKITYVCSDCEEMKTVIIAEAKGHAEVIVAAVEATCTATGLTEGKHCSVCDEILIKQEVINKLEHNFVDNVCNECGYNPYNTVVLQFALSEDGESYSVINCDDGGNKEVVIPSIYNEKFVTNIGSFAFFECISLETIYYTGTEEQWNDITIDINNENLINVTIVYNYVPED